MAHPGGSQGARIAVVLARRPADLGEWIADGAAFDAAGADALWIEPAPEPELDPLALAAALAAVTYRSLLVSALPSSRPDLATTLTTIDKLSRGRLRILGDATSREPTGVASTLDTFLRVAGDPVSYEYRHERWVSAPVPDSRAGWRTTLREATEGGFRGVLVPADPRLIDILRNPDDPGQRLDLHLAQG